MRKWTTAGYSARRSAIAVLDWSTIVTMTEGHIHMDVSEGTLVAYEQDEAQQVIVVHDVLKRDMISGDLARLSPDHPEFTAALLHIDRIKESKGWT